MGQHRMLSDASEDQTSMLVKGVRGSLNTNFAAQMMTSRLVRRSEGRPFAPEPDRYRLDEGRDSCLPHAPGATGLKGHTVWSVAALWHAITGPPPLVLLARWDHPRPGLRGLATDVPLGPRQVAPPGSRPCESRRPNRSRSSAARRVPWGAGVPWGCRVAEQPAPWSGVSAFRRGLGKAGLGGEALSFDGAVDRGASNAEKLGDLQSAVLAAVHQGDEVRFLLAVELGLLAPQPTLWPWRPSSARRCGGGSGRTRTRPPWRGR
jgi:hypothetical protein